MNKQETREDTGETGDRQYRIRKQENRKGHRNPKVVLQGKWMVITKSPAKKNMGGSRRG